MSTFFYRLNVLFEPEFDEFDLNPLPVARIQQTWNMLNVHGLPALRLPIVEKRVNWMSLGMSRASLQRQKASAVEKGTC